MPQTINTNINALTAQRNLNRSEGDLATSLQRLSSGLRINSAKDDAAGLSISDRMTAQIRGLNQAVRNANDGISIAQVSEGALSEVTNALQRMRELAVQSANDTNSATDRASLQKEVSQLAQEISRIATQTQFNGKSLLDGSFGTGSFQVGAYAGQTISFAIGNAQASAIGSNVVSSNTHVGGALTAATDVTGGNNVAAQSLTVVGPTGSAAVVVGADNTAKAIAAAVNAQSSNTGVTATATNSVALASLSVAGTVSFNLYGSNTAAVAISANVASATDLTALSDAVNAAAASTGITATLSSDKASITLSNTDGSDIAIENYGNTGAVGATVAVGGVTVTEGAADSLVVGGAVAFTASTNFSVSTDTGTTVLAGATVASALSSVASMSVGTQAGASAALAVVDGALSFVDDLRAALGAVQNRFSSVVASNQATAENVSAARSRIQDADFAAETAMLSRAQILQQAGIAMLSQANQQPQNVLSLLR
ncbi:flagellin [Immundisolibacter sp.]|uniref:flagellin N-terminal helical domain-containing protein n=1 Tax=Immundisolibacter sp. TaxID=1934948 RepID=UPI00356787BF